MEKKKKVYVEILKLSLIILVPLFFLQFIFYSNFSSNAIEHFYDIGSEEDDYLSPTERISDKSSNTPTDYRNLTGHIVYFDVQIHDRAKSIDVSMRFKDNFPEKSKFSIGARDKEEWNYKYNLVHSQTLETLFNYPYSSLDDKTLFKLNPNVTNYSIADFMNNLPEAKIATNTELETDAPDFKINDYESERLIINTAIRESQNFYVYIKDDFEITVWKRDLNWYENDDELEINLYDLDGKLMGSEIIPDDGEDDKEADKNNEERQKCKLSVWGLKEGVYKLELKNNGDMLILRIDINQNKFVADKRVFLAQSDVYFTNFTESSHLYFGAGRGCELRARAAHDAGNQALFIDNGKNRSAILVNKEFGWEEIELPASSEIYELTSNLNDVTIAGCAPFAFSEDSWFDPFASSVVKYKEDIEYLKRNADYVLVDYVPVEDDGGGWKIATTSFNIEEDDLYINEDGKLSMLMNIPHLAPNKNETNQMHVPIDWIKITVHKEGWL